MIHPQDTKGVLLLVPAFGHQKRDDRGLPVPFKDLTQIIARLIREPPGRDNQQVPMPLRNQEPHILGPAQGP